MRYLEKSAGKLQDNPTEHHFLHFLPRWRELRLSISSCSKLQGCQSERKLLRGVHWRWEDERKSFNTGNPNAVLANRIIKCIYAVLLANKIIRCIFLCSCVFMSRFNPIREVNIAGYQMGFLVLRVVNRTLKFRLTFLILLTINFPLTATRESLFSSRDR